MKPLISVMSMANALSDFQIQWFLVENILCTFKVALSFNNNYSEKKRYNIGFELIIIVFPTDYCKLLHEMLVKCKIFYKMVGWCVLALSTLALMKEIFTASEDLGLPTQLCSKVPYSWLADYLNIFYPLPSLPPLPHPPNKHIIVPRKWTMDW